jgi:hypothetical protein
MTTTLQPILQGIKEGRAAFLLSGRSIRDLDVYPETQGLGPLLEILRQALKTLTEDQGMILVTYSRAEGLDLEAATLGSDRDRQTLETAFHAHHLLNIPQDDQEIPHVLRGISSFCRNTSALPSANGGEMRVCFLLDFAEDLAPSCQGNPSDAQIVAAEHGNLLAQSLAMRNNGHAVIWHTHDAALVSSLVRSAVHPIHLPQPKAQEKLVFLQAALQLYDKAKFEEGLSLENIAFLTSNTPNRGLEGLIRASHRGDRVITAKELVAQKSADVQMQSEGTLTVLDTAQIDPNQSLEGVNSIKPQQVLRKLAEHLANGSPHMPMNVLLVGPPATGKTEMSLAVAKLAGVSAYQMHSPKGGIVGETERKSELQQRIRKEAIPNIAFVDEITEALPLERSDFDGDSGATRAVAAALLTALADESLRGKSLLLATTNCPYRIGAAMRSRFMMIPVLHPLQSDYGAIVLATVQRINRQASLTLSLQVREIAQAANLFYTKGANPRQIRAALSNALLLKGSLSPEHILFAAEDCTVPSDRISSIYADLWAVATCSAKSFFPWADCLDSYPFPDHLEGLVNRVTGEIDRAELERRIEELKPHANL